MFMCYHISNQLRPHSLPLRSLFSLVSAKAVRSIESSPSTALSLRHLSSLATVSPAMAVSTTGALFVAFSLVGLAMLSSFASLFVRFGLVLRGVSVPADEDCASEVLRFDPFFDFFIVVSGCVGSSVVSYVVVSAFVVVLHMWSIWRGCAFARCSLCTLLNCSRTAIITVVIGDYALWYVWIHHMSRKKDPKDPFLCWNWYVFIFNVHFVSAINTLLIWRQKLWQQVSRNKDPKNLFPCWN